MERWREEGGISSDGGLDGRQGSRAGEEIEGGREGIF